VPGYASEIHSTIRESLKFRFELSEFFGDGWRGKIRQGKEGYERFSAGAARAP
jgi:hypothetical protein